MEILRSLGFAPKQSNEVAGYTLLACLDLKPGQSWSEAVFLIDERARCQYASESASRSLGYSRAELLGMGVADWDPDFPAELWSDHWRELKEQQSLTFESRNQTREGRVFPVEISANYFEFEGQSYNLAIVRDITERKRAEEELRRSEAYLAEAESISHTGSWAWQPAGVIGYWSKECYRIMGFDPAEGAAPSEISGGSPSRGPAASARTIAPGSPGEG